MWCLVSCRTGEAAAKERAKQSEMPTVLPEAEAGPSALRQGEAEKIVPVETGGGTPACGAGGTPVNTGGGIPINAGGVPFDTGGGTGVGSAAFISAVMHGFVEQFCPQALASAGEASGGVLERSESERTNIHCRKDRCCIGLC